MSVKRCYYEVLEVERSSSQDEVKKAYRRMAIKYHPDKNPGDQEAEELFKECAEAYEVLRDPEKRRVYDQYGHDGLRNTGFSGFNGPQDIFSAFSDIFEGFFGFSGGGGRRRSSRGRDLEYRLELTLEEAAMGKAAEFSFQREAACEQCGGTGMADGSQPPVCSTCGGQGQVLRSQGFFRLATTCPDCRGAGRKVTDPCRECHGVGRVMEEKNITVRVPAGIDTGQRLRIRGEGEAGRDGAEPGDLFVSLQIAPHSVFKRDGADLYRQLDISMFQAALGAEVGVETLVDGVVTVDIPAGVDSGHVIKLDEMGMPSLRGSRQGRLYLQLVVRTPRKLSKKQRELLIEAAALGDRDAAALPPAEGEEGEPTESPKTKKRRWFG